MRRRVGSERQSWFYKVQAYVLVVHNSMLVVRNGREPLSTGCTMQNWGACTIVHGVHNAIMVVHNDPSPLCNGCTMVFWSCTMVVHHCAPSAL